MWRSSLMCLPDTLWGGGSHRPWRRHSCWMHWSRRYGPVDRPARSITVIKVLSMYRWPTHSGLREAGLLASTGSTGDSYDNAMAESINGLYKAEVIHRKSWKNRAEVELATHSRGWTGITIDDCWKGWAILLRQKQKKLIMLPSETMIWQPEFTDKILPKPGAVQEGLLRILRGV